MIKNLLSFLRHMRQDHLLAHEIVRQRREAVRRAQYRVLAGYLQGQEMPDFDAIRDELDGFDPERRRVRIIRDANTREISSGGWVELPGAIVEDALRKGEAAQALEEELAPYYRAAVEVVRHGGTVIEPEGPRAFIIRGLLRKLDVRFVRPEGSCCRQPAVFEGEEPHVQAWWSAVVTFVGHGGTVAVRPELRDSLRDVLRAAQVSFRENAGEINGELHVVIDGVPVAA